MPSLQRPYVPSIEIEVEVAEDSLTPIASPNDEKDSAKTDPCVMAGKARENSLYASPGLSQGRAYGKSIGFM